MIRNIVLTALAAAALGGCVTSKEIIVGRDADGKEITRNAAEIDYKKASQARIDLAMSFMQQREMRSAKENLNIAEEYNPDSENLNLAWGRYYTIVGDFGNAEKKYQKSIDDFPESGLSYTHYGHFLCGRKEYDRGLEMLMKAVTFPKFTMMSLAYQTAAQCSYDAGRTDDAKMYFEKAMSYGGNSPGLLYNYAYFSLESGDYAKADSLMHNYDMFQHPETEQTLFLKIRIAQKTGEYATSEVLGKRLLKYYPKSEEAKKFKAGEY